MPLLLSANLFNRHGRSRRVAERDSADRVEHDAATEIGSQTEPKSRGVRAISRHHDSKCELLLCICVRAAVHKNTVSACNPAGGNCALTIVSEQSSENKIRRIRQLGCKSGN